MKKLLIGLTGFTGANEIAGCGKDTVSSIICNQLSIQSYGFADPIYDMLKSGLGIDGKSKNRELKNSPINWLSSERDVSLRYLLETLGTEWGRNSVCSDLWLRIAEKRFHETESGLVIRDVRFTNEVDLIDKLGGVIIHIIRSNHFNQEANLNHSSNQPLCVRDFDYVIYNDGDLDILKNRVIECLKQFL